MANTCCWYETRIPENLINDIIDNLDEIDKNIFIDSLINIKEPNIQDSVRKSKHCWVPTSHWIGGFLWYYIMKANRDNFLYDISHIENELLQYTIYNEGDHYDWHTDMDIADINEPNETVRKLSFTVQLSKDEEYTGGNLEFADFDDSKFKFKAPRSQGSVIIFDSRTPHRVSPVESGVRKSLVGWVEGKRWR